jgi:hypothetical protein
MLCNTVSKTAVRIMMGFRHVVQKRGVTVTGFSESCPVFYVRVIYRIYRPGAAL